MFHTTFIYFWTPADLSKICQPMKKPTMAPIIMPIICPIQPKKEPMCLPKAIKKTTVRANSVPRRKPPNKTFFSSSPSFNLAVVFFCFSVFPPYEEGRILDAAGGIEFTEPFIEVQPDCLNEYD